MDNKSDSKGDVHKDEADVKLMEFIFSVKPEALRNILIKKHEKFLNNYGKELRGVKEKRGQEVVLKKRVEILPDKTDLLDYWGKGLEENLNKVSDDALAQEIREKITEFKKEKEDAEIEFQIKLGELEEIEKEINENNIQNRGEWLARKVESHEKSLDFWKNYMTEEEKKAYEERKKKEDLAKKTDEERKRKESEKKVTDVKKLQLKK
ncbi:hypothetical protein MSIBF_A2140015 [groundwater metagenome]|uniref:Uncharacterized protein n=1 Tax=groundwater metagenome TaxID=717931 RepID=A0A098E8I3_9ZZZZ